MEIIQMISPYNRTRRTIKPVYICIHDVGEVSSAKNNAEFFNKANQGASADFFVQGKQVYQIVDYLNYYSWAVGDGHGTYGIWNANSVSIEMCLESDWQPSAETITTTIELTKKLMVELGINADHVVRHYDASRKPCPKSFMANDWAKWKEFKAKISREWKWDGQYWLCYENGQPVKSAWRMDSVEWCYLDASGHAVKNTWAKDSTGKWCYCGDNYRMVRNTTIEWQGHKYYFGADGYWDGKTL